MRNYKFLSRVGSPPFIIALLWNILSIRDLGKLPLFALRHWRHRRSRIYKLPTSLSVTCCPLNFWQHLGRNCFSLERNLLMLVSSSVLIVLIRHLLSKTISWITILWSAYRCYLRPNLNIILNSYWLLNLFE